MKAGAGLRRWAILFGAVLGSAPPAIAAPPPPKDYVEEIPWSTQGLHARVSFWYRTLSVEAESGAEHYGLDLLVRTGVGGIATEAVHGVSHRRNRPLDRPRLATARLMDKEFLVLHRAHGADEGILVTEMWDLLPDPRPRAPHLAAFRLVLRAMVALPPGIRECERYLTTDLRPANDEGSRIEWIVEWPVPGRGQRCRAAPRSKIVRQLEWRNGCFVELAGQEPPALPRGSSLQWEALSSWAQGCPPGGAGAGLSDERTPPAKTGLSGAGIGAPGGQSEPSGDPPSPPPPLGEPGGRR